MNDVINSKVSIDGEDKEIIISEQLVREVLEFPDDENSPTGFPERMVKGCMLRIGYSGPLNKANYLKACFMKPYMFFIHSVIHVLSHRKGGYDAMKDHQMCMVTALVLNKKYNFSRIVFHYMKDNITFGSKSWVYPRFGWLNLYPRLFGMASNVQFDPSHNICCVYDEKLPKMVVFKEILEFMKRLPIQKALTDQHKAFKSHITHFWKNAVYDDMNDVINSKVSIDGEDKEIIINEQLVREVSEFADDENSPTGFPERMVKGCMLRMGYSGPLNKANYLKACFMKPYKFFIHLVIHTLSHRKGGYDVMKDYQMCMVTALVLNKKYNFSTIVFHYMKDNITSRSKSWVYPRFVQMMLDNAYLNLVKDEQNDLMVLHHMDNETMIRLSMYTKNWRNRRRLSSLNTSKMISMRIQIWLII
ncbi:hypothetical protein Hdeb2414_s0006g00211661 [Helianthus debilis subsp. tardiflorus]